MLLLEETRNDVGVVEQKEVVGGGGDRWGEWEEGEGGVG